MKPETIVLRGGRIVSAGRVIEGGCVVVRGPLIAAVGSEADAEIPAPARLLDVRGFTVVPGLMDLHVHGLAGQDLAEGGAEVVSEALARFGVTSYLATLTPAPPPELRRSVERLALARDLPGARMLGIYLEGPYLSPERAGVLHRQALRLPSVDEVGELLRAARGRLRIMTVAPELEGASELIQQLTAEGVVVAAGHSSARFDQMAEAISRGLRHATHVFNAMRPFEHREPGVVGAALDCAHVTVEIIADGEHLHPATLRLLHRIKGSERLCLVSDATPLMGLPGGTYEWLGRTIHVSGRSARAKDGTLAGSVTPLNVALGRFAEAIGEPWIEALPTVTGTPARILSSPLGVLSPGREADIAVLDENLTCRLTLVRGRVVHWAL